MTEGSGGLTGIRTNLAWKALFEGWWTGLETLTFEVILHASKFDRALFKIFVADCHVPYEDCPPEFLHAQ